MRNVFMLTAIGLLIFLLSLMFNIPAKYLRPFYSGNGEAGMWASFIQFGLFSFFS